MTVSESIIGVRQLNLYVKNLLEGDVRLCDISVTGELSNLKKHYASGHWYFTLKDEMASVRCVMFRSAAARVSFDAEDGMLVTLRGRVSLYEKDGQYQFYAEEMRGVGEGELALHFELVKKKLEKEGLFDADSKRPIPKFPSRIAVVTSDTGAAVRDILNVLSRRCPNCEVVMCPASVQGESAVSEMTDALDRVYALDGIDTIIIGRGGGSAEDLAAFNSEVLARRIYESPIPVISAVGHETDFSICDFVADLRAPTPSAAAELATPDMHTLLIRVNELKSRMVNALQNKYELLSARYNAVSGSYVFKRPQDYVAGYEQQLDGLTVRLIDAVNDTVERKSDMLTRLIDSLDNLSPLKTISRGFAAIKSDKGAVCSVKQLKKGDNITVVLRDGNAVCIVESLNNDRLDTVERTDF